MKFELHAFKFGCPYSSKLLTMLNDTGIEIYHYDKFNRQGQSIPQFGSIDTLPQLVHVDRRGNKRVVADCTSFLGFWQQYRNKDYNERKLRRILLEGTSLKDHTFTEVVKDLHKLCKSVHYNKKFFRYTA